jgi:hypothetical protein
VVAGLGGGATGHGLKSANHCITKSVGVLLRGRILKLLAVVTELYEEKKMPKIRAVLMINLSELSMSITKAQTYLLPAPHIGR